jgi:hypothetical protein
MPADRDLWEYFANLYKNSKKGIKGRGRASTRTAKLESAQLLESRNCSIRLDNDATFDMYESAGQNENLAFGDMVLW